MASRAPRNLFCGSSLLAFLAGLCGALWDPKALAADIKRTAALVLSLVALGILGSRFFQKPRPNLNISPRHPLFWWCIFIGLLSISRLWGEPSGDLLLGTWMGALGIGLYLRFYEGDASLQAPSERLSRAPALCATTIASIASIFVLIQAAQGERGMNLHGGHGNPNWLGLVLAFSFPLSLELAFDLWRRGPKHYFFPILLLALLQIPALWLSHSRVAWIALPTSLFVAAALWLSPSKNQDPKRPSKQKAALAFFTISFILIAIALYFREEKPGENLYPQDEQSAQISSDIPIQKAWQGRLFIWRFSAGAALEKMPFGHGLGNFSRAYLDAQGKGLAKLPPGAANRGFENATTAHSDWIESAATAGLPALLAMAAALLLGFVAYARAQRPLSAASLLCAALCAAGDSPLHQPGFVLPFSLLLACAPQSALRPQPPIRNRKPQKLEAPLLLVALAISAFLSSRALQNYMATRLISQSKQIALPELQKPLLLKAIRLDPRHGEAALMLGLLELSQNNANAALYELKRSASLLPNLGTLLAIGNAYMALNQPEKAIAAYHQALAWNPASFRVHLNLALAFSQNKKFSEAQSHLNTARALFPGHPRLPEVAEQVRKARIDIESQEPQHPNSMPAIQNEAP